MVEVLESSIKEPEWWGDVYCQTAECEANLRLDLSDLIIKRKPWWRRIITDFYNDVFDVYFICPECKKLQHWKKARLFLKYKTLYWAYQNRLGEQ